MLNNFVLYIMLFFVTDTYVLYKWMIIIKAAISGPLHQEFIMTIMNSCFTDEHLAKKVLEYISRLCKIPFNIATCVPIIVVLDETISLVTLVHVSGSVSL